MKVYPHGSVVFCDDTRQEKNNKYLYIGVYQNDMLLEGPPPWRIGGLWCHVRYNEMFPDRPPRLKLEVRIRDQTGSDLKLFEAEFPYEELLNVKRPEPSEGSLPLLSLGLSVRLAQTQILAPTRLRVVIIRDDEEILLGALRLKQSDEPIAGVG